MSVVIAQRRRADTDVGGDSTPRLNGSDGLAADPDSTGAIEKAVTNFDGGVLTGPRRLLVESLHAKGAKSGPTIHMYLEALRAIFQRGDGNENLHVAAFELREMMWSLPTLLDLPVVTPRQLRGKVRTLHARWAICGDRSSCRTHDGWQGELDSPLREFMESTEHFFRWVDGELPSRAEESAIVLHALVPTAGAIPKPILDRKTKEWKKLIDYFNYLAHHNGQPLRSEFLQHLKALEDLLLNQLAPRTFDDQDEIDALILQAEAR